MKLHTFGTIAATLAWMGMIAPMSWAAAPTIAPGGPTTTAPVAAKAAAAANSDVALRGGGLLVGQVVDQQGVAKANTPVSIQFAGKEVVSTTTDANGVFAAKGLRGGQYQILTPQGGSNCRLWAADTAPPAARPAALVVAGNEVVRGAGPADSWVAWVKCHPYITAGTVAAAVAVPVAFAVGDHDHGS